jgi:tetratricopeptide (TPR) repeat protein
MTRARSLRICLGCAPAWVIALVVGVCVLTAVPAAAEPCAFADIKPSSKDPVAVFAQGRAFAADDRYPEARAMYRWLLQRDAGDREATLAVARLDAWDRCFPRAEASYKSLLDKQPKDVEARAGLIDVLLWSDRWPEARTTIDVGLALSPRAPELWARRARLLMWSGDRQAAVEAADRAEALAPRDADMRELRDQIYRGQVRASTRADVAFSNYPSLYTFDIQALNHFHRFELGAEAQLRGRHGAVEKGLPIDGLYWGSAAYHTSGGTTVGLSLGFGAPAVSVPFLQTKAWFSTQIGTRWSAFLSYSFWQYHNDKTVHILAPVIGYQVSDALLVELRGWGSYLLLQPPAAQPVGTIDEQGNPVETPTRAGGLVFAAGARAVWHVSVPLAFAASYTYGPQLDQAPGQYNFLRLKSHIISVSADWLLWREFGVQPMLGFEHRRSDNSGLITLVYTAELAAYTRW